MYSIDQVKSFQESLTSRANQLGDTISELEDKVKELEHSS